MNVQGTDEQQVAGDNFRAIRPTYNHKLNWTAGHSPFELSLSDADCSPCEVLAAAWEQADEQKWKIVPAVMTTQTDMQQQQHQQLQQRLYSIRVRRRDARFGLSLQDGRLALRLVLPASPDQAWKVETHKLMLECDASTCNVVPACQVQLAVLLILVARRIPLRCCTRIANPGILSSIKLGRVAHAHVLLDSTTGTR